MGTKISGFGFYVPENIVTNYDLEKMFDTSNEWIVERTGIEERRFITPNEMTTSDLSVNATKKALEMANIDAEELDLIIVATMTSDYLIPGTAVIVQKKLGLKNIPAIDIRQQCSGFIYGLDMADLYIKSGRYKKILLVGAEVISTGLDLTDRGRDLAVLFGDGAGAFVLENSQDGADIVDSIIHADGRYYKELWKKSPMATKMGRITVEDINTGKVFPQMNGKTVFKHAVTKMPAVVLELLERNNLKTDDIAQIIPHQANLRITQMVAKRLGLSMDKVYSNIHKYGNTTAGTIPIAFTEAFNENKFKRGDLVISVSFGSGFTWGANLIKF
ncbi:MAG: beta-ketoacyl-ACP synthase III [Candidatus Marinimicrobia bacterium]|nr:beta-ketoacyl-ACP synthase III [Candidatus Neomarinimicrobiota bacterium]